LFCVVLQMILVNFTLFIVDLYVNENNSCQFLCCVANMKIA
jgi:hypothetical protein